jgi:hypothetical protein
MQRLSLLSLLWLTTCTLAASGIPDPVIPQGVGVNIHFVTGHDKDLDLIAAAGFKFIRMDFSWQGTESEKGKYDWAGYDELTANLSKRGIRPIYILDYSNPLYESTVTNKNPIGGEMHVTTASPQHPESIAAFASWAAAAAKHFHGLPIIWEIWNEPNIFFWSPKPDVAQYTALALATCKAIREAEPEATIVGPASSEFPWEFLEHFLRSGILTNLDAVSVHPYRNYGRGPETAREDYERLRKLIEASAPDSKRGKIPILSGEWGYASHTKGVSLEKQASFAARQQLANLLHGIPLSIWYDWKNDGLDPAEGEHNFGTVSGDLKPKPAYNSIQTLTRELNGFRVTRRLEGTSEADYVLLCTGPNGKEKLAVWTTGEAHSITFSVDVPGEAKLHAVASDAQMVEAKLEGGKVTLNAASAPVYLTLK